MSRSIIIAPPTIITIPCIFLAIATKTYIFLFGISQVHLQKEEEEEPFLTDVFVTTKQKLLLLVMIKGCTKKQTVCSFPPC